MFKRRPRVVFRRDGVRAWDDEIPLRRVGCGPFLTCGVILFGALAVVAGVLWFGMDRSSANAEEIPTLAILPSATSTETVLPSVTPDAWALTGTAIALATETATPTATASATTTATATDTPTVTPTVDYCWFLTPTATATPTGYPVTPDAWAATGTAIALLTATPTLTPLPLPGEDWRPPRAWCDESLRPTVAVTMRSASRTPAPTQPPAAAANIARQLVQPEVTVIVQYQEVVVTAPPQIVVQTSPPQIIVATNAPLTPTVTRNAEWYASATAYYATTYANLQITANYIMTLQAPTATPIGTDAAPETTDAPTAEQTPEETAPALPTATQTATPSETPTATATELPSATPSLTPTPTATDSPTSTPEPVIDAPTLEPSGAEAE